MKRIISLLLFLFFVTQVEAQEKSFQWYSDVRDSMVSIPEPEGPLNDFEGIFPGKEAELLNRYILLAGEGSGVVFAVVTIDSLFSSSDQLRHFANTLGDKWGVGEKEKNNGIVIVFGRRLRKIWIAPGLGLESRLTTERLTKIIDERIIPRFKEQDYAAGIMNGVSELCRLLEKQ